jgi:hypothetical protein
MPFSVLSQARAVLTSWRADYNGVRPHSALANRTPQEFRSQHIALAATLGNSQNFGALPGPPWRREPLRTRLSKSRPLPNAIGSGPCVADHIRCAGHSDRAHAPFASDVNLFCNVDGDIDLDAEVTNGAPIFE